MVSKIAKISFLRSKSDHFCVSIGIAVFTFSWVLGMTLNCLGCYGKRGLPLYRDGKPLPSRAQHPRVGFCQTLVFTERSDRSGLALSRFTRLSPLYAGTLSRARYSSRLESNRRSMSAKTASRATIIGTMSHVDDNLYGRRNNLAEHISKDLMRSPL